MYKLKRKKTELSRHIPFFSPSPFPNGNRMKMSISSQGIKKSPNNGHGREYLGHLTVKITMFLLFKSSRDKSAWVNSHSSLCGDPFSDMSIGIPRPSKSVPVGSARQVQIAWRSFNPPTWNISSTWALPRSPMVTTQPRRNLAGRSSHRRISKYLEPSNHASDANLTRVNRKIDLKASLGSWRWCSVVSCLTSSTRPGFFGGFRVTIVGVWCVFGVRTSLIYLER